MTLSDLLQKFDELERRAAVQVQRWPDDPVVLELQRDIQRGRAWLAAMANEDADLPAAATWARDGSMILPRYLTVRETAICFRWILERLNWRFTRTDDDALSIIVGDDPPNLSQAETLGIIRWLEPEFLRLISDRVH